MLVDINPDLNTPSFILKLSKRNGDNISELGNTYDVNYNHYLAEIDELTFNIPYYIMDMNHNKIKNPNYDLIKGDLIVNLNDEQHFIINAVDEHDDEGILYKSVHCYSREYELVEKKIRGYKFDARKMYVDPLSADPMFDTNGFYWGILNYIETLTSWRVDYINSDFLDIYRGFNISEDNLISIIQNIQVNFDCIFQFDTVNKKMNIYKLDELGQNKGLYISDENYIQNLSKNVKHDEIKTRLYLYGKDNISISSINLTGQPYIENFDFYKTTEYMSQDLIDALDSYDTYLSSYEGDFAGYLSDLETYQSQYSVKRDELVALQEDLAVIEQDIDIAIANGDSISSLNADKEAKELEISNKQNEIDTVQSNINAVYDDIDTLQSDISANSYFTTAQLDELDPFIKYETLSDSAYTEELLQDLLEKGYETLNKISQPAYEFTISSVDFFDLIEAQHDWGKLIVGDIINLKHTELNDMIVEVRLVNYQYNFINKELQLQFSNKTNINDPYTYNRDLLKKLNATSTSVDFSKYGWDKAPEAESLISSYIDNELDLAQQAIVQSQNQDPILDNRGLWLRKENVSVPGTYEPEQIRAVNNVIALTEDNWETVSTAITPQGIIAEKVYGKLGVFAEINSHQVDVTSASEAVVGSLGNFNNISITSDNGIVVSRDDGNMTISMDATDGIVINNGTSDIFYADTSGNLKIKGELQAGSAIINTSIDVGSNFSVNGSTGTLTASNANISGAITSSSISSSTINIGSNFSVDSSGNMNASNATIGGDFKVYDGSELVARMYKDSIGGRYEIYDVDGNLDITIGVEPVGANLTGGTVKIYDNGSSKGIFGTFESSDDPTKVEPVLALDASSMYIDSVDYAQTAVLLVSEIESYGRGGALILNQNNSRIELSSPLVGDGTIKTSDAIRGGDYSGGDNYCLLSPNGYARVTDKYQFRDTTTDTTYDGYTGDVTIYGTTLSIKGGIIVDVA